MTDAEFVQLYNDAFRMTLDFVLSNSGTYEDAEDLLQDGLVVFFIKCKDPEFSLDNDVKPTTFLYGVITRLWYKKLRARGVFIDELPFEKYFTEKDLTEFENSRYQFKILNDCLLSLRDRCRKVLEMFYFEGYSMNEIAAELNLASAHTATAKKYTCLGHVRRCFFEKMRRYEEA